MTQLLEGHTVRRYDGELNNVSLRILEMGGLVLEQCREALASLDSGDVASARAVIQREHQVDALELRLDSEIASVVGRRGPVARDLRAVMAFSKGVTDLERIGDEAAKIAHIVIALYDDETRLPSTKLLRDVHVMGKLSIGMLMKAVSLFDTFDVENAQSLLRDHLELDAEFQSSLRRVTTFVLEDARMVGHAVNTVLLVKSLERIGDHARNLAEYVVYLVRGEDVRHPDAVATEAGPAL